MKLDMNILLVILFAVGGIILLSLFFMYDKEKYSEQHVHHVIHDNHHQMVGSFDEKVPVWSDGGLMPKGTQYPDVQELLHLWTCGTWCIFTNGGLFDDALADYNKGDKTKYNYLVNNSQLVFKDLSDSTYCYDLMRTRTENFDDELMLCNLPQNVIDHTGCDPKLMLKCY